MSQDTGAQGAKNENGARSAKNETESAETGAGGEKPDNLVLPPRQRALPMPGLAAIGLYMLVLAGIVIIGVASGHFPPLYLVFSVLFIAAGLGLMLMLRWAWALTLAAILMLMSLFIWRFSTQLVLSNLIQGLLNMVFFLYLVRTEVRSKLK